MTNLTKRRISSDSIIVKPKRIGDSDGCGETAYGRTNLEEQETDDRGIGDHGHDTNFTGSNDQR